VLNSLCSHSRFPLHIILDLFLVLFIASTVRFLSFHLQKYLFKS
jgi:hypothetical protein